MKRNRAILATGLAGIIALTACTDVNTPTADPKQRTKEGAAIGAVTGLVLGARAGKNKTSKRNAAIVGAALGGLAGGAIGARLDAQAADLQANISDGRVQIINTGKQLIVRMPNDILFAIDSAEVGPVLRRDLRALARNLQRFPDSTVVVIGHTDSTGDAAYNQNLSVRRASSVANILIANGVSARRIQTVGRGETDPIATNLTPEGRAQNRRVDIVIIPNA